MARLIGHRGPDDQGVWYDDDVGLAHTRLSVVDLSSAGHQPLKSATGRYVIVFNGEIYNHLALRHELEKLTVRNWRGHSDTETLIAAIEQWGIEPALKKALGMFAFALWDKYDRVLTLARDRMGEKPLYYGWINDVFVFASELKPLRGFNGFKNPIDRASLALFLRFNSIPAPHSIYQDIYKLEPGYIASIGFGSKEIKQVRYWSTEDVFQTKAKERFTGTPTEAVKQLENVLSSAINKQMQSDVPIGAFLSGGIDSSLIASLMQSLSPKKVNTFSIGFDVDKYDEAENARVVASHLGTNHFDMYVTERDALDVIPILPDIYDEPFADSSQIPTYLVARLAKQKVSVALSGDAGDELFGGYNRYVFASRLFNNIAHIPIQFRGFLSKAILSLSEDSWDKLLDGVLGKKFADLGFKIHKGANVLTSQSIKELHFNVTSQIQSPSDWLIDSREHKTLFTDGVDHFQGLNSIEQMMAYDLMHYLPTDILTKVDRAAMSVSLETRVPFLDPTVVNFSAALPLDYKIRNGVTKWVLRELLYRYLPKKLFERPKMGFGVPLAEWLRGPLRAWAESLLDAKQLYEDGFFNVPLVREKWHEHLSHKQNWSHQLWNVLIFQAWLLKNK